jgi:dTDP-glucose 4,6-dehydratase
MKTALITGANGFIGHYLVEEFLKDHRVICVVRPGSTNMIRLEEFINDIEIIEHDIKNSCVNLPRADIVLHAGANPSAADSLSNPTASVMDNVLGTLNLLEHARYTGVERFVYYSSGEVYGPVPIGQDSQTNDAYNSNSPYAAGKAAGEELCLAYANSFNVPASIIHINNTFGPRCQSNRLPVIIIRKLLNNETLDIHVGPSELIGGRRWFYAGDVASHTRFVLEAQSARCEKWNSAGNKFINNLEFAQHIAQIMGRELRHRLVPVDRPGHDLCFSVDPGKLYELGWQAPNSYEQRLTQTVHWYQANPDWLTR